MFLAYIDDSGDEKTRCFSALIIHERIWNEVSLKVRQFRRDLKTSDGILVTREFHATEFVAGRGHLGPNIVTKRRRCEIFVETLQMIAALDGVRLLNCIGPRTNEQLLFERLVVRLHRTMEEHNSRAIIFHDEGKDYTPLVRRLRVYNPMPSQFGAWPEGPYRNIPTDRIIEDIVFRKSHESTLIQMADFCAYALFRSEFPLASKAKYGLDKAFDNLRPICLVEASAKDPRGLGIIRA